MTIDRCAPDIDHGGPLIVRTPVAIDHHVSRIDPLVRAIERAALSIDQHAVPIDRARAPIDLSWAGEHGRHGPLWHGTSATHRCAMMLSAISPAILHVPGLHPPGPRDAAARAVGAAYPSPLEVMRALRAG